MDYSTFIVSSLLPLLLDKAAIDRMVTEPSEGSLDDRIGDIVQELAGAASQLCREFLEQPVDPERTFRFEHQIQERLREAGRGIVQAVYNHAEPAAESLPKHVHFEASMYTRLNRKTPQNVWTLFGQIRLRRIGYRPTDKSGDATIFPLALALGLVQGASPAPGGACGRAHE